MRRLVVGIVLLGALAAPAQAELQGFRSVLAQGQGTTATAADLAANQISGEVPPPFVNQQELYTGIARKYPTLTRSDLDRFYKDADPGALPGGAASTETPRPGVTIVRDATFNIPRIEGETRADVMFGSGYAQAQDRLFLMDVLRRTARGSLSELIGPSGAEGDAFQLTQQDFSGEELTAQMESLSERHGAEGQQLEEDLTAYVAGINAWIEEVRSDPSRQPAEYAALGAGIEPWTPADTAALATFLVSQFNVAGLGEVQNATILEALRRRAGSDRAAQKLLADLARREDPEAPVTAPDRRFEYEGRSQRVRRAAYAVPDRDSVAQRDALVGQAPAPGTVPPFVTSLLGIQDEMPDTQSNALLVDARRSRSGKPLAAMGPQVGYFSPQIFSEVELRGGGIDVAGVVFPGATPYVLIGRTPELSWSGTSPMTDNADVFAEPLCDPEGEPIEDPAAATHHRYKGRCIPFTSREQVLTTPASPVSPGSTPQKITLRTLRSVHGPVTHFGRVNGRPVAFAQQKAVDFYELDAALAFARLAAGEADDPRSFDRVWRDYPGAENWYFIDDKRVSMVLSGFHPRRARGTHPLMPTWGTGRWDWRGFKADDHTFRRLPYRRNPRQLARPRKGYIVNWNNKEARGWRAPADVWTLGPTHRSLLLERRLLAALRAGRGKINLVRLVQEAQGAHQGDLEVQELLPLAQRLLGARRDEELVTALALLTEWRAAGGEHRDLEDTGAYEHGAAIALMREWVPRLSRAVFEPRLGKEVIDLLDDSGRLSLRPGRSEFGGWHGHLVKALRRSLGARVRQPLSRGYCGSRRRCARTLARTLRSAVRALRKEFGGGPEKWTVPVELTEPVTAGAIETPPFPLQNRGTFHQIVELRPGG
jgi:acyl-homoserine lactone acylase PvdQ